MDQLQFLERIKRLAIIAMFSDDDLMEKLVLKGGNLLDVVFGISTRASVDLDFSIEEDFESSDFLKQKLQKVIPALFSEEGYVAFDINLKEVPPGLTEDMKDFWGGYKIDFKIIEKEKFQEFKHDQQALRKRAQAIGDRSSPKFKIDISKHESCGGKQQTMLDDYTIYTYSPEMVVAEKLRAICQQMPEYTSQVKSHQSARARDFVDIHVVAEHFAIDFSDKDFQTIVHNSFDVKRVPLRLIDKITAFRESHRPDFQSVKDTVKPGTELQGFDFYFDYLLEKCNMLKPLWDK